MTPVNIDIKSDIDMVDEDIFTANPSFEKKNTLVYKGIASNMTVEKGDGILSTTGKVLKIDGDTLKAGSQSFSLPTDRWTVQDTGSVSIGKEECAVNGFIAGATNDYFYIKKDDEVVFQKSFSISTDDSTSVYSAPILNTVGFAFVKQNASTIEIYTYVYENSTWSIPSNYGFENTISTTELVGSRMYAGLYYGTSSSCPIMAIGFDDDDYRKRFVYVKVYKDSSVSLELIRGFGCLSASGEVTGEPVPVRVWNGGAYSGGSFTTNTTLYPTVLSGSQVFSAVSGPNVSTDARYKVLPNGVISAWTGWVNPSTYSTTIDSSKTFLEIICDENAAIGASITDLSSTQSNIGLNTWHWKIHGQMGINDANMVNGQEYTEKSTGWTSGKTISCPSNGSRFFYSADNSSDTAYCTSPESYGWLWQTGYKINQESGSILGIKRSVTIAWADEEINQDCEPSCAAGHYVCLLGDWTYIYDSMKSYADTTNYDSIFPALRVFFNNSSTKGKYWDYGPGWTSYYVYNLRWSLFSKELVIGSNPLEIAFNDYNGAKGFSSVSTSKSQAELESYSQEMTGNPGHHYMCVEPTGNMRCINANLALSNYWAWYPDYLKMFDTKWTYSGDSSKPGYTVFLEVDNGATSSQYWADCPPFRLIECKGDGEGLTEQAFNFGGLGDYTLLSLLNWTCNQTPDLAATWSDSTGGTNQDLLRLGIYSSLGVSLTWKGTLLFNAADLDNKFHIYKDGDDYIVTIYNDRKAQWLRIKKNGDITIDKLTDYMFRLNICGDNNLLIESRDGTFDLEKGFNGFIGEETLNVMALELSLPDVDSASNNVLYYAQGINSDLSKDAETPSFLFPATTITAYCSSDDIDYFEEQVLRNKNCFIKNKYRIGAWDNKVDVYYTSTQSSTDVTYKETQEMPSQFSTYEGKVGVQTFDTDKSDTTYWIDSDTVIYPVAIGSIVSGINYATSTIDLPGNYAVRFYSQNNKTWCVYNQNAQVYFGNNIFTIMGSNYYFDGQAVYYLGSEKSGGTQQYSDNILIAYAIGMQYLCNAPSEAYFYSPFDKCLYIFTSSNTMQKSNSLSRFGDVVDACYCPVNQSLYILFDGYLIIKTQDDMSLIEVEGNALQTTADGVQVIKDNTSYEIHSPYKYEDLMPLDIKTEWLGTPDSLTKYSFVDIVLHGSEEATIKVDLQTIAGTEVTSDLKEITIKKKDWTNNLYRLRLSPKNPIGNAFRVILYSEDKVGLYNLAAYIDKASNTNAAQGTR